MPAISATAPGKIILFGEHAVVYGQPAIAAPVSQVRTRSIITARPDQPRGWINLQAPDIGLEATWNELPVDHPLVFVVKAVLTTLDIKEPPAMTIRVSSTIPIAAGLGSGAAVSVAIIRALSGFLGRPLPDEQVSAIAFEVDKLHHGTPSGIDNTTITYERPVYFSMQGNKNGATIKTLRVPVPFTIVIGDTGIPSSTAEAVGDVRMGWLENRDLYQDLFERTGRITNQACQAIESGELAALGPLMDNNQDLLERMGVSSVELDQLVNAARQAGAGGAKLSGGGRGGNMFALAPEGAAPQISDALSAAGAKNIIITRVAG
jgi:mevalonate kinase